MKLLPKRKQIVWWSERSGWGHLYLYSESGALMKALTSGDWLARSVHHVDEDRGVVYFSASGRAPARDPYLRKLYSVAMDTGTVSQLTPEDCDHQVLSGSPSGAILLTIVPLSTNLP
jgi:Tol biopolymer transport system component